MSDKGERGFIQTTIAQLLYACLFFRSSCEEVLSEPCELSCHLGYIRGMRVPNAEGYVGEVTEGYLILEISTQFPNTGLKNLI